MNPALAACLLAPPPARTINDVADWWQVWQSIHSGNPGAAALAIAGGFAADRVGWAFACGYQAALRALVPDLSSDTLAALCVTEVEGNRPRHIRTTIVPQPDGTLRIDGAKRWTTLGPASTLLLIVGALPVPDGADRPVLRVARVPTPTQGLVLQPMPPTRFVPEVPHAQVLMHDVRVSAGALLPNDGYDAYVKPFRTIEDLHVTLAVLAYLLREGRVRHWPAAFNEQLVAALGCCRIWPAKTRALRRRTSHWPARCASRTVSTPMPRRYGLPPATTLRLGAGSVTRRCSRWPARHASNVPSARGSAWVPLSDRRASAGLAE